MSAAAETNSSPRVWIAAIVAIGFLVSLAVGLVTLAGGVLAVGVWKGNIDNRVTAVETASKEQIAALSANSDKAITAVAASCKDMVAASDQNLGKHIENIERDRKEHIDEANRWRAEHAAITTRLVTVSEQQQKEIDVLVAQSNRRSNSRP